MRTPIKPEAGSLRMGRTGKPPPGLCSQHPSLTLYEPIQPPANDSYLEGALDTHRYSLCYGRDPQLNVHQPLINYNPKLRLFV
ncbi:hypothetical protein XELAEV_18037475mg [Xenopus laevis]|uniref:Uncharacterized protein n=1 Tax=Xenopus laevis TaxID=8355 RepID=A0A974CDC2_XENLA|nr:hypothetical protein XELAEV_18037475mg [Xenopus laevis]